MTERAVKLETSSALGMSWAQLAILLLGRLILNTAFRIVYPLLAFLAVGFGVDLQTASLLITVQVGAALLSPVGGLLVDRVGERLTMVLGLVSFTLGALGCALATRFLPFLAGYGLVGLGTSLFMPAVQTYASSRSDYAVRGRVLGLLELSWALAALVGVVGLTQLVRAYDSWAPAFWALAGLGALMTGLTLTLKETGTRRQQAVAPETDLLSTGRAPLGLSEGTRAQGGLLEALRLRGVPAILGFICCQLLAVELIFVVYASWLERDFGASTEQLGLVFGLLGLVELGGSLGATLLTDRIGKRRAVLMGFAAVGLLMLVLPLSAGHWALFLGLFLLFDLCFEFAIVSVFPLVSGLATAARGRVVALSVAAVGMGRIIGSLAGPRLFEAAGFGMNATLAGVVALIGVLLGLALVREGSE